MTNNNVKAEISVRTTEVADKQKYRVKGAIFLTTVATVSALVGFSKTLANSKKQEQKFFDSATRSTAILLENGSSLALRALAWGTFYAVIGTGTFCYGIWKLSGAKDMEEFRHKMGSGLPRITSTDPPKSRTEFEGLTDLIKYLSSWGKE